MADRGAMASRPNAIQTPKARREGKNISGFYQKNTPSQINFEVKVNLLRREPAHPRLHVRTI
jgi:hypothetical protein